MVHCRDALAVDADLVVAAELATREALAALDAVTPEGVAPDLACVFACGADPDEVGDALERAGQLSGAATTVGCSAGGVIGGGRAVELTSAVSVWLGVLPGARLRSFHLEVLRTPESLAVLGLPPVRPSDHAGVLLADPYSFPADAFVGQLSERLPRLPLAGGLAGGLRGAGSTRLLVDGVVHRRGAVGVLIGDAVRTEIVVSQGCRPVGPVMTVTAADGNTLQGLAGVPALTKLEEIVAALPPAEQALATTGLHIGVAMDEYADQHTRGDFLVRGVVGADPENGSLVVGDVVDVGRTVQFQVRDAETADSDLTAALDHFRRHRDVDQPVDGALLFSCSGRGADLFASADHDVRAVLDGLGARGVAGFFANGEIGPVDGRNHLHGFTASLLTFG